MRALRCPVTFSRSSSPSHWSGGPVVDRRQTEENPLKMHENIKACGFKANQTSEFDQSVSFWELLLCLCRSCSLMGGVKVNGAFSNYLELRWQKSRESDPRARFCQGSRFSQRGCFWFECCHVMFDLWLWPAHDSDKLHFLLEDAGPCLTLDLFIHSLPRFKSFTEKWLLCTFQN